MRDCSAPPPHPPRGPARVTRHQQGAPFSKAAGPILRNQQRGPGLGWGSGARAAEPGAPGPLTSGLPAVAVRRPPNPRAARSPTPFPPLARTASGPPLSAIPVPPARRPAPSALTARSGARTRRRRHRAEGPQPRPAGRPGPAPAGPPPARPRPVGSDPPAARPHCAGWETEAPRRTAAPGPGSESARTWGS